MRRPGLPAIDVSAAQEIPAVPRVVTNDDAMARLAADHCLKRGCRHLAQRNLAVPRRCMAATQA